MSELTRSIVLWCPDWPVRAAVMLHPEVVGDAGVSGADGILPLALIDRGEVFACSAAARRSGVRRGLRVREAQSRCPGLVVLPYDPAADARFFEPVLAAVEEQIPGVQPMRPGTLALRGRGPARYYGGEKAAARMLLDVLAAQGIPDARAGVADGPFAAEQAARARASAPSAAASSSDSVVIVPPGGSPAFLARLPVEIMADAAFVGLCRRLGLTTLGALAGFGEAELVDRFGVTGLRVHALVTGRDASVVVPRAPQRSLERQLSLEPGLDRIDQLAFAVRRTADEVIASLARTQLVCTAVTITIEAEAMGAGRALGPSRLEASERTWLHPRWFTAADLVDRVRWQLQGGVGAGAGGASAGAAPGGGLASPIVRVTFTPESVDAAGHHEDGLWGGGPDERVHHVLSRVQSMLGHEGVVTAAVGGGRMLDDRQVLVPWGDRAPREREPAGVRGVRAPWPGALPDPLPATVFLPRMPVAVLGADGSPVGVDDRGVVHPEPALFAAAPGSQPLPSATTALRDARPIGGWAGPWTVDERWWDAASAQLLHRFGVVDADGVAWVLLCGSDGWHAEARYD